MTPVNLSYPRQCVTPCWTHTFKMIIDICIWVCVFVCFTNNHSVYALAFMRSYLAGLRVKHEYKYSSVIWVNSSFYVLEFFSKPKALLLFFLCMFFDFCFPVPFPKGNQYFSILLFFFSCLLSSRDTCSGSDFLLLGTVCACLLL